MPHIPAAFKPVVRPKPDPPIVDNGIDHPPHYNAGGIEVIDAIEAWGLGFCLGNVVKYVARADHKGNRLQDLQKAAWYLNREIENEKRKEAT